VLISVVTPFHTPRLADAAAALAPWLAALGSQAGPCEVILAGTAPVRANPWPAMLDLVAPEGFAHRLAGLHIAAERATSEPASRAASLNQAALAAGGEVLLILHADVKLPPGALDRIRGAAGAGCLAGAFPKAYQPTPPLLGLQARWLNGPPLRRGLAVGTNAVWLRRELWSPLPDQPLLEDFVLADRLRRRVPRARWHVAGEPVLVSAGKYMGTGVLESMAINGLVVALWRLGLARPEALAPIYRRRGLPPGPAAFWPSLVRAATRACRV
jgi:hypothetical protein